MKLTKFFALLFAFSAMTFTFTACGDDEEDIDNLEELINGDVKSEFTKKTSTELEVTLSLSNYSEIINAQFDEKTRLVTKVTAKVTYPNEAMAKYIYEEMKAEGENASLKGRTITIDITEDYEGETYDEVYKEFEEMIKEVKRGEQ